jgi:hypothetical protein
MTQVNECGQTTPCKGCPWLTKNHGRPPFEEPPKGYKVKGDDYEPDWYGKENAQDLWSLIRDGEMMTCHATDPGQWEHVDQDKEPELCAGMLVLVQREMKVFERICRERQALGKRDGIDVYLKRRPNGLTRGGMIGWIERVAFGGSVPQTDLSAKVSIQGKELPWEPDTANVCTGEDDAPNEDRRASR